MDNLLYILSELPEYYEERFDDLKAHNYVTFMHSGQISRIIIPQSRDSCPITNPILTIRHGLYMKADQLLLNIFKINKPDYACSVCITSDHVRMSASFKSVCVGFNDSISYITIDNALELFNDIHKYFPDMPVVYEN